MNELMNESQNIIGLTSVLSWMQW